MNDLRTLANPFQYQDTDVRIAVDDMNNIWFSADDVCSALGINLNDEALANINDQQQSIKVIHLDTGEDILFVDTIGLYQLTSKLVRVKINAFNNWVSGVVVPTLRKNGLLGEANVG